MWRGGGGVSHLALVAVRVLAKVVQSACGGVHRVERGEHRSHLLVDSRAGRRRDIGKGGVGEDVPVEVLHDVEGGADDAAVGAQGESIWHGHLEGARWG